jgi:hypothetical protein
MNQWILETYKNNFPDQKYAFLGTVNWMKALGIYIKHSDFESLVNESYLNVQRINSDKERDLMVFENLLMAYHNHASLSSLAKSDLSRYDISRTAIISWYYSVYFAGSAMIAALLGQNFETHTKTADVWLKHLKSTVTKEVEESIIKLRSGNDYTVQQIPYTIDQAKGAILSYLKGSAGFERNKVEQRLLTTKEFKELGLSNFRKKIAQEKRDKQLKKNGVSFLHQAFRYRGKVNYRDSLFLTYGEDKTADIEQLIQDLEIVSNGFHKMCVSYIKARISKESWELFENDLNKNTRLSLKYKF